MALLCQFLSARSIVEVATRHSKNLTEQAQLAIGEAGKAKPLATFPLGIDLAAASPQSQVALCLHWLIVIWYGEDLRE